MIGEHMFINQACLPLTPLASPQLPLSIDQASMWSFLVSGPELI
jgi:hypothetical protein